jgi:hypothetical protein
MRRRRTRLPILLVPALVYLAVLLLLGLFVVHPPLLGWVGLGIVAAIVVVVALVSSTLFSRARVNAVRLHPRIGSRYRLEPGFEQKARDLLGVHASRLCRDVAA